jgi:phage terminase small subunit
MSVEKLNVRQAKALAALLKGSTAGEAANEAGCSIQSVKKWLKNPDFRAALLEAETEVIDQSVRHLLELFPKAIAEIERIVDDPTVNSSVRLRASIAILDYLMKIREMRNIEDRLSMLEKQVFGNGGGE